MSSVTAEDTGGRKLAEFVANHVLSDIDGDEFVPVMHSDGESHEIG